MQCSPPGTYSGALDVLKKLIRNEVRYLWCLLIRHSQPFTHYLRQGAFALYKGATPPAVAWAAIDSVLLGSLHNYRLFLLHHGMSEPTPGKDIRRLTVLGHGIAGLGAGLTRYVLRR